MRTTTAVFFGWLSIAMMLFAIPELPVIIPTASAVTITGATPFRPYGPYVQLVKVSVFTNEVTELASFKAGEQDSFDWSIPRAEVPGLVANPDAAVSDSIAEAGMFQIDINHHAPLFGITQQEAASACLGNGLGGLACSTKEPTTASTFALKGIAHLIDKASFVNTGPCGGGFCLPIDDGIPFAVCGYPNPIAPCTTFAQRASLDKVTGVDNSAATLCASLTPANPCLYRLSAGSGGRPSTADLVAAQSYLVAAGLALGTGTIPGTTVKRLAFPSSGCISTTNCIIFAIRSDDAKRLLLGNIVADAIDSIFDPGPSGQPVTQRIYGNIRALGRRVFLSVPADDWSFYTGGWGLSLDATFFNPGYDSQFGTNFCGGDQSLFNLNYGFYCNPVFDKAERIATFTCITLTCFNSQSQASAIAFDDTVATIPIYSRAQRTLAHNGWANLVSTRGSGFTAYGDNWLNVYAKPGFVSTGGLGAPGGGNPNLLRAGFRQGTDSLNIFQAGTVWEAYILNRIYDSASHFNPRDPSNPAFAPYSVLLAQEPVETFDTTAGTTTIDLTFRTDILFHDGVQLTAKDFVASGLAFRDVPQGGFGGAAAWAPVISTAIPIPGSTCGVFCARITLSGTTFIHKLNMVGTPIIPLHLWDTNGDGLICSDSNVGSCAGKLADFSTAACNTIAKTSGNAAALAAGCIEVTSPDFDPMASGFLIGSGPFLCLDLDTGKPGGSCSQTAAGVKGGQGIGPGGRFLLTRDDNYILCCPSVNPSVESTALSRFTSLDINHLYPIGGDHILDILDVTDAIQILHNVDLANSIFTSRDTGISGGLGASLTSLNEIDLTSNTGNAFTIGY